MSKELTQRELDFRRCPICGPEDLEAAGDLDYLCHGCREMSDVDELVVVDAPRRDAPAASPNPRPDQ